MSGVVNCAAYTGWRRVADVEVKDIDEVLQQTDRFIWIGLHEPKEDLLRQVARALERDVIRDHAEREPVGDHARPAGAVVDREVAALDQRPFGPLEPGQLDDVDPVVDTVAVGEWRAQRLRRPDPAADLHRPMLSRAPDRRRADRTHSSYFLILAYSVDGAMPSASAARVLLPAK